jgi:integrase
VDTRAMHVAPRTLLRDLGALKACLNAAVDADRLARSPARKGKVSLPLAPPPRREGIEPADLARLVKEIPDRYRALVLAAGVLGLRWGEAIALRVCDVDSLSASVRIARQVTELDGKVTVAQYTKTDAGQRTLAIPAFVLDALAEHLTQHRPGAGEEDLIFVGPKGGVLRRSFAARVFNPAARRAGLKGLTFHGLRHGGITAMGDAGVPPHVTQRRAGHATSRLTMELYSHRTDSADRAAAGALETHFADAFSSRSGTLEARDGSKHPHGCT